jgi:S-adenosyl-L-methionine hydrolase (adenosine-forming)
VPTIVLLTDFGSKDYFAGVIKGVISSINPVAHVVDLTHDIEPQNVRQAAFVLWASRKYFPDDAIFVCVVDPGVGTDRKILCGKIDGQAFVAPDNGLLDYVKAESAQEEFRVVSNSRYFLNDVSTTFHGRDIFAPVAAHLSRGIRMNELGETFKYPQVDKFYREIGKGKNGGNVVYQDKFGNVFTSLVWNDILLGGAATVKIGDRLIRRFYRTYASSETKEIVGVRGSSGLLELAVNRGNAARLLKSVLGQKLTVTLK